MKTLPEIAADIHEATGATGVELATLSRVIRDAVTMLAACKAVAHQLSCGEASDGDKRDIAWCATTLREVIDNTEGVHRER